MSTGRSRADTARHFRPRARDRNDAELTLLGRRAPRHCQFARAASVD